MQIEIVVINNTKDLIVEYRNCVIGVSEYIINA